MRTFRRIVTVGVGIGALSIAGGVAAQTAQGLFEAVGPAASARSVEASPTIVRSRLVAIAQGQLQGAPGVQQQPAPVRLNFFPDADYVLQVDRTESVGGADYALFGAIQGIDFGRCTLIVQAGDKVTGNCSSPLGTYQVRYHSEGVHVVREIDQSQFPPEADPIEVSADGDPAVEPLGSDPDPLKDGEVHADDAQTDDDGSIVDMLVAYTTAAKNGSTNIVGEILLAVAETNQAYINSNIYHRVRLVGTTEVNYTESGILCNDPNSDLTRLRATSDGFMDNLHGLRNSYGADQVTLIVQTGNACGCAYFMNTVATSWASNAFSVVRRDCATGYFSFGHELGHNMSARHDCYVDTALTPYNYNHGYVHLSSTPSQRWRTIMAYANACSAAGYSCTRIQWFSNPAINYLGAPTGTSGTGCAANNRQTHVNTDLTVSRFRDGYCHLSGMVDRVTSYAGNVSSSNYVYIRPYATASYYQYFRTTDNELANTAIAAARRKVDVTLRGDQSCFDNAYDFGGQIDYFLVNP